MLSSLVSSVAALLAVAFPQEPPAVVPDAVVRVTPPSLELPVGQKFTLKAEIVDVGGRPIAGEVFFFSRARRAVRVDRAGEVEAIEPGTWEVVARATIGGQRGPEAVVPVTVPEPTPVRIELRGAPDRLFVGTTTRVTGAVLDASGASRNQLAVVVESSDPNVAALDPFGKLTGRRPGQVTLRAKAGGLGHEQGVEVVANPVVDLALIASATDVRTGDVVHFATRARDAAGVTRPEVPVHLSFEAEPDDALGNGATGQIEQDGRFVAETPGLYTIVASCGDAHDRITIRASQRFTQPKKIVKLGHGAVLDVHTSDLWVWEGVDGRDYAVTGTWGANGDAIFWDVTDPTRIERLTNVTIDARTVNDVKVSEDGRLCVLSREGASNRKNGLVIVDVEDPRHPKVLSGFDDELTGGVHNVYIAGGFVYALSDGRRYDVIDIRNPKSPSRVGSFQLFEPGASIHDVWVSEGIAFSSNWQYGLRLVDVGNGIAGGSPSNPVEFASYAYPSGWNHAAFPWRNPDTKKFYVIAGDEAFPYGLSVKDNPTYPRGWIHFVDFSDFAHPSEVARYQVPEAGTHNLWVDGTTLYVAYYNAGLRVVDVSGELMGDLYRQGREIGWFLPTHPKGVVPNAPMTWGPQPYKGNVFISDWNSGLWALKVVDDTERRR